MPFIKKERRSFCDKDIRFAEDKGDACYLIYREFVEEWKKEPRWTTVHNIYKTKLMDTMWLYKFKCNDRFTYNDWVTALHLAWQVFMDLYVMPYERDKRAENGDI